MQASADADLNLSSITLDEIYALQNKPVDPNLSLLASNPNKWEERDFFPSAASVGTAFSVTFAAGICIGLAAGFRKALTQAAIRQSPALIFNQMLNSSSKYSGLFASSAGVFFCLYPMFYNQIANSQQKETAFGFASACGLASGVMTLSQGKTRAAICAMIVTGGAYVVSQALIKAGFLPQFKEKPKKRVF